MQSKNGRVNALKTAFRIIEVIKKREQAGVTEIANTLDMPKSTAYYHLESLVELGYLIKQDNTYHLSLRFVELGEIALNQLPIYEVGKPEVEQLAKETNTNSYLIVEENDLGVIIYMRKENEIDLGDSVGNPVYLTTTAMGKALLAHLPEERVDEIVDHHGLPKMTDHSITDRDELDENLAQIRERGYAVTKSEQVRGLRAIGVPVLAPDDTVHGAISIAGPKQVMSDERLEGELPEKVLSAANIIELKLIEALS